MNELFGIYHIVALCISIVLIGVLIFVFNKLTLEKTIKIMMCVGMCSEIIKVFYFIISNEDKMGGYLPKSDLPLHLCSMQIIFLLILNYSKNEKIKKVLLGFMMPSCLAGAFCALLLPTYSARNSLIITFQFFGYHSALVAFAITLFNPKKITFVFKDYLNCLKFLVVIGFLAIYINSILNDGTGNVNFMYVVSPPEDNLPYLNKDQGWFVYFIRYSFLAFVLVSLCYIKQIISKIKQLFNNNKTEHCENK